jgi:hypothetical protein
MLSSADREWRELATKLLRGYIPRHSTGWVLVELHRLDRKARRQEAYHRRMLKLQAEAAELIPNRNDYHRWRPGDPIT